MNSEPEMTSPATPAFAGTDHEESIVLSDGWSALARGIPGAVWDTEGKRFVLPREAVNPRSAMIALKVLPTLGAEYPELVEEQANQIQHVRPTDHASALRLEVHAPATNDALHSEHGTDPFEFQRHDLGYLAEVLRQHTGAYNGWERGMGKTYGAFAAAEDIGAERLLAVVPNTAKGPVWEDHVLKGYWSSDVMVLPNEKVKREKALKRLQTHKGAMLVITHPEALDIVGKTRSNNRGWDRFGTWDLIVADESHRFKNAGAKQSRALKRIPAEAKLALSGSIIENNLEELFSQLQWLFPTRYRSKWRDWNLRFIDYIDGPFSKVAVGAKPEALQELADELGVFMVYRTKEEVFDMPPRTDQDLRVDLSPAQRRAYADLVNDCLTKLDDGTIVAGEDGLPVLQKLRQVATGLDLLGNVADSTKLDLAVDLISDTDEPIVLFGWYKASIRALGDRLNEPVALVDGDKTMAERDEEIAAWKRGDRRVLLGTISTVGESQNFQRASQVIMLDRHWNPMKNQQAEDRVYRLGQEKPVTITHIIARNTVDELRVQPALASKEALRRTILGGR